MDGTQMQIVAKKLIPQNLFDLQPNKHETTPNFIQLSQNLTLDCLLIQLNFPAFMQFLHELIIKLFYRSKQNNFIITSCKNWQKQGNSVKSTNNPMSSFGLIEKNLELSHIYQAVLKLLSFTIYIQNMTFYWHTYLIIFHSESV